MVKCENGIVHSYIGITPDFGSEKRGSTPRWTTKAAMAAFIVEKRLRVMEYTVLSNTNNYYSNERIRISRYSA